MYARHMILGLLLKSAKNLNITTGTLATQMTKFLIIMLIVQLVVLAFVLGMLHGAGKVSDEELEKLFKELKEDAENRNTR